MVSAICFRIHQHRTSPPLQSSDSPPPMPKRKQQTSVLYFDFDELEREAATADVDICLPNGRQVRRCVDFFASPDTDSPEVDHQQDGPASTGTNADIAAYAAELEHLVDEEMSRDNATEDRDVPMHSTQTFATMVSLSERTGTYAKRSAGT